MPRLTRHDCIVLAGVLITGLGVAVAVIFHAGQVDQHVLDMDERLKKVEEKVDNIQWHLIRQADDHAVHSALPD